jgi:flagellar hook-associated protein 2
MSQYFTATASADSNNASLTVNSVKQLASAQKITGKAEEQKITMKISDPSKIAGKNFNVSLNGTSKSITLENDIAKYQDGSGTFDMDKLTADINAKLDKAFGKQNGAAKIAVAADSDTLNFSIAPTNTAVITGSADAASALGFKSGAANYINTNSALSSIFPGLALDNGKIKFSVNEVDFEFNPNATMKDVMDKINKSDAGVTLSYSDVSNSFTMTANQTGEGDFIRINETGSDLFAKMYAGVPDIIAGKNAILTIGGEEIIRSSNTITMENGITLNLLKETPDGFSNADPVTAKVDASKVVNQIKDFVEEYNALIAGLTKMIGESRPKSNGSLYLPLTEEQKSAMNEKEIAQWEEMGKTGLLYNDITISKMLASLRVAVSGAVGTANGGRVSLSSIGVRTASYFEDKTGKLTIDEEALTKAIESDPDAISKFFTDQASDNKGLAQKFKDIFDGNISAKTGSLGTLVKMAGTGGSSPSIDREASLEKKLSEMDKNIIKIQNRYYAAETKYYKQFSALETAISKLNTQASYLADLNSGNQ